MRRVCRFVILAYIIVCIAALAIIPMTAAGTFGIQPDPLSGIYALLLASPRGGRNGRLHPTRAGEGAETAVFGGGRHGARTRCYAQRYRNVTVTR